MAYVRCLQSKVLTSRLIPSRHRKPYWELGLSCGHTVFRVAREFYKKKHHRRTRCERCNPTEYERGLTFSCSEPRRCIIDRKPKRPKGASKVKTCRKCGYQTRRDDVMKYHIEVSHALTECSCGLRRMRVSIPVSHELKSLGYFMTFYCPRCDDAIRVEDGAVYPVSKELLDSVRQIYHNVQDRKGVNPYVKAFSNRGEVKQATRSVACQSS